MSTSSAKNRNRTICQQLLHDFPAFAKDEPGLRRFANMTRLNQFPPAVVALKIKAYFAATAK